MAGAPQGPVYQVQVLDAGDFQRSPNPEEEMQVKFGYNGVERTRTSLSILTFISTTVRPSSPEWSSLVGR